MPACAWLTGLVPRTHMSIKVVRSTTICECVQDCESAKHEAILWYLIEKIWKSRAMLACAWLTYIKKKAVPCLHSF